MERPNDPVAGQRHRRPPAHQALGSAPGLLGDGALSRALARWVADGAVDEAARARSRQHWLRVQAEEEATLAGVLLDLAERGRRAVLDVGGQRLSCQLVGLGADFVAGRSEQGRDVLVPLSAIEVLRTEPGAGAVVGDRAPLLGVTLAAALGPVAADRAGVVVRTRSGTTVHGQLRAASAELLQVRADTDPPTATWVPLDALAVLVVEP